MKETQKQKVLRMLDEAGPEGVTSNQFYAACLPRFGARIHELKAEGHDVVKEPVEQGHFRYILVGRPFVPQQSSADLGEVGNSPPNFGVTSSPERPGEGSHDIGDFLPSPGQLFEVIEDGPKGPVNPYEWEAA